VTNLGSSASWPHDQTHNGFNAGAGLSGCSKTDGGIRIFRVFGLCPRLDSRRLWLWPTGQQSADQFRSGSARVGGDKESEEGQGCRERDQYQRTTVNNSPTSSSASSFGNPRMYFLRSFSVVVSIFILPFLFPQCLRAFMRFHFFNCNNIVTKGKTFTVPVNNSSKD
jgi:hypothetical protein